MFLAELSTVTNWQEYGEWGFLSSVTEGQRVSWRTTAAECVVSDKYLEGLLCTLGPNLTSPAIEDFDHLLRCLLITVQQKLRYRATGSLR